jgi:hypothetical protein
MSRPPRRAGTPASRVLLSVDPARFADVVRAAAAAGLVVEQEMSAVGVVAGRLDPRAWAAVAGIDGVQALEEERTVQLPPPDAPVQ